MSKFISCILMISFFLTLSVTLISCKSKSDESCGDTMAITGKEDEESDSYIHNPGDTIAMTDKEAEESDDYIPIHINLTHPDDLQCGFPMRYKCNKSQERINIFPSSTNYDSFNSHKRLKVPRHAFYENTEDVEYLSFDAIITNNRDEAILIDRLILDVEESRIDTTPYLYLCTVEAEANTLYISDEGWADYGGFSLDYTLLKKGENFNGKYKYRKKFSRPQDCISIDFTEDMIRMGYKWDLLKSRFYGGDNYIVVTSDGFSKDPSELFYPFEWSAVKYGDITYYLGFCRLMGRITFNDNSHSPVEFSAELSLSTEGGFGAALDYNDHFDFELNSDKRDYEIAKPYNITLRPQSTEKIAIKIKCDKSSFHKFRIRASADGGNIVKSLPVSLHYMMPRHAVQTENLTYQE